MWVWMRHWMYHTQRGWLRRSFNSTSRYPFRSLSLFVSFLFTFCSYAEAAVRDITPTDVTTRAASVIWVSDEPVISASVHVFADQAGTTEITSSLTISLISEQFPPAHDNGIVKVDIVGLTPDTSVYIQTETTSSSGVTLDPGTGPFIEIHTAFETTKANSSNQPIVNDLIRHPIFAPDGVTAAPGTLMLLQAQGVSAYPISAFVGEGGFSVPDAVVDMNNIYDTNGFSAEVPANQVLVVSEFRGLLCGFNQYQILTRFRRAPTHLEAPAITELENPGNCYLADTVCDGVIDVRDGQYILNLLNATTGSCEFNPDLDMNGDGVLNVLDGQFILNLLGTPVP